MKVTIPGFIHWKKERWEKEGSFSFFGFEVTTMGYVPVMPYNIEADVPDDFNPVPKQIAALEEEKAAARRQFNERIAQLNEQIGKLQALTFDEVKS